MPKQQHQSYSFFQKLPKQHCCSAVKIINLTYQKDILFSTLQGYMPHLLPQKLLMAQ